MRLLYTTNDGRLSWTDDLVNNQVPPYAILSHTWGEQEVAYKDLVNHKDIQEVDTRLKGGYQKIFFCSTQAKRDGLDHFWVDTCCIDKSNSQELQEAINSMFRWYQNAKKCYVYLSDVEYNISDADSESCWRWKPAFRKSRWFTRGWTLQELLAPASVAFYSKEGKTLGDKQSLRDTIHEITGISVEALSGSRLSDFSVDDRFSWAVKRQTTRGEDRAYCLLGIFGVHLPLIYSEGEENAFHRLRDAIATKESKGRSRRQEEKLDKVCSWLSAPDPSINYQKAHKQRQAETGLWLLQNVRFVEWKESAASRLWLSGIPGCGKTILSSTIIEHLLQHCNDDASMVTAYFYFDFNDARKRDPELMLRSLLCQLLQRLFAIPEGIDALLSACEDGQRQPSLHALLEVTPQVMQKFAHVYIVLDALDECAQRLDLMDVLKIVAERQLDNVHLLLTSRKEWEIERSLKSYIKEEEAICLQGDVVDKDIQRYIQQRLSEDETLAKWNRDAAVRQEIEFALMSRARGMFRWAVCQLDMLAKCRNRAMLRRSLTTLPQTLDQTYERILIAISKEDSEYAMRILQWLTFSARPLSVEEIAEVVAIDVARDPAFDRDEVLEDPLEALNICSSLVTITNNKPEGRRGPAQEFIVLAHYSVREYLVSDRVKQSQAKQYSMEEVECHNTITKGSLMYLIQIEQLLSAETLGTFALARYAAEFWGIHLRNTGDETEGSLLAMDLMSTDKPAFLNWIRLCDPDSPWKEPDLDKGSDNIATPLYYAASLDLTIITRLLLGRDADVNVQGGVYGNALQIASAKGHMQVIEMLLDKGADPNAQGGHFDNALQAASFRGHGQVVERLLDKGADVNAQVGHFDNALQAASLEGHKRVVEVLLNKGADVNMQGGYFDNALRAALYGGHEQVVEMLLDKGADINVQGGHFNNTLQAASYGGHEQVVKMLLDRGTDVNVQGGRYGNALQAASDGGHKQVVKMLLDRGAKVNAQGRQLSNALQAASYRGHEQVVDILLNRGANASAQGGEYGNALQAASDRGHGLVVKMLLDRGADVNAQGGRYINALQAASDGGHGLVVKMLLDRGADVNAQGGRYGNALETASAKGHEQVVEILLNRGADINAQGGCYSNALNAASARGHERVVKMLLDAGAHQPKENDTVAVLQ